MDGATGQDCEQMRAVWDRASRAHVLVAVHDTRLGPAHGGIRRWRYDDAAAAARDVVALARAMTWKCALAEVPAGGGKAVILDRPDLDRAGAYRVVGRVVESLGGTFFTGPDVNTSAADLAVVAEETRYVATAADDGPGDLAAATADGVLSALVALAERLGRPVDQLRCIVQGLGAVGFGLCERLAALGASLIVADVVPARVDAAVRGLGARAIGVDEVFTTEADVFAPCALGGAITVEVARSIPVLGVCGAANNVFATAAAPAAAHERGLLVVPDFVANAGALIQGALWNLERCRVDRARLDRIGGTTGEVLARAAAEARPPIELALELARERVERAGAAS
ncbi:MAG: Glu/Leu/Phe/Val dehydrogenase dimerization domain-containing protein [Planctomycetota bacterium]|nr:Glu/Leu/Phe/Val dehydrogenase dimerization domain-containing protein [Planctomycetota bacterium]